MQASSLDVAIQSINAPITQTVLSTARAFGVKRLTEPEFLNMLGE